MMLLKTVLFLLGSCTQVLQESVGPRNLLPSWKKKCWCLTTSDIVYWIYASYGGLWKSNKKCLSSKWKSFVGVKKLRIAFISFRKLLNFGEVSWYLGYNALSDFFPQMRLKPNPTCEDRHCLRWQAARPPTPTTPAAAAATAAEDKPIVHDDNEWGKSLFWYSK